MATKCDKNWAKMGSKWRQNGDKLGNKMTKKWRQNDEKMAIK